MGAEGGSEAITTKEAAMERINELNGIAWDAFAANDQAGSKKAWDEIDDLLDIYPRLPKQRPPQD